MPSTQETKRPSSLWPRLKYWAGVLIFTATGLIILELVLRTWIILPVFNYSDDTAWGRLPAAGTYEVYGIEGFGVTHYSSDGEIATPFSIGENVAVLGDSHTEGMQVNDDEKFASVAEAALQKAGLKYDFHNLGFSGGTVADYVYMSKLVQETYHPKMVIIQLSQTDFQGKEGFDKANENYFVAQSDGSLGLVHKTIQRTTTWVSYLRRAFSLISFAQVRLDKIKVAISTPTQSTDTIADPQVNDTDLGKRRILQMNALHSAYQWTKVIIVALPYTPHIEGSQIVDYDPDYVQMIKELKSYPDWVVVDPSALFSELAKQGVFPRGFNNTEAGKGHLNAAGHAIIGKLLAETIEGMPK